MKRLALAVLAASISLAGCSQPGSTSDTQAAANRKPDVRYVPTPEPVVDAMLAMAEIGPDDVLYDLGSGDGRIPITAAQSYGIRAVGIDIDPKRVAEARENARAAGVEDLVTFHHADLFETDFSEASVVTLYLLDTLNVKLRPKLLDELEPGARVVSHAFSMSNWTPDDTQTVHGSTIYRWNIREDFVPGLD